MSSVKVLAGQSLFDIAVQECGSIEAVMELAVLNGISITDDLDIDAELLLPEVINKENVQYLKSRKLNPATAIDKVNELGSRIFDNTFDHTFN